MRSRIKVNRFVIIMWLLGLGFASKTAADLWGHSVMEDLIWLADSCLDLWPDPSVFPWNWGESVMMYGLLRATDATGDERYEAYVRRYLDSHLTEEGDIELVLLYPDVVAPANVAFELLKRTGDPRYDVVSHRLAEWLMDSAPRAPDGAWYHFPLVDWHYIDTLFMTTVFLAGYGSYCGNDDYVREALAQHNLLAAKLYSGQARLFWHGWDQDGWLCPWATPLRKHNPAFWGRGNGWAVSSLTRVLELADPTWQGYSLAKARLRAVLNRLDELQDRDTGAWWTVLDAPYALMNYRETSVTALVIQARCYAGRLGLAPAPSSRPIEKATAYVRAQLVADDAGNAHVMGASIGTNPTDYWGYVLIPTAPDRPWGIGSTLMMLAELLEN